MTVLDFPLTSASDSGDPLAIASAVRSFGHTEFMVALNASGAKLTRAMRHDVDTLVSFAEIGVTGLGADGVRSVARRVDAVAFALVAALRADLPVEAEAIGKAYDGLFGGQRRQNVCNDLAHALADHFRPVPLAVIPFPCDPS